MSYVIIGAFTLLGANIFLGLVSLLIRRTRMTSRRLPRPARIMVSSPVLISGQAEPDTHPASTVADTAPRPTLKSMTVPFTEPTINASDSPAAQGAQISSTIKRTDFRAMGTPPMAQETTAYVFGDDLYDESFSITDASGDLLAEMGVGVAEGVDWEDGKNVVAFELWLFDAKSGETSTQMVLTQSGYNTDAIRRRFEKQGAVHAATNDLWVTLESKNITVRARIVDVQIRPDTDVPEIIFQRLILEMAAWPNDGSAPAIEPRDTVVREPVSEKDTSPNSLIPAKPSGPQIYEQRVDASYTLEYASRAYLGQPFTVIVQFGQPAKRSAASTTVRRSGNRATEGTGMLAFAHRTYQDKTARPQFEPQLQVSVTGSDFEFQIPVQQRTISLQDGQSARLEFDVKPLDTGSLLLLIETVYLGQQYVPERELGTTIMRNPETGEVEGMSTRNAPSAYYPDPQTLSRETVKVRVQTILGFQPGALNFLTWFLGLVNVMLYVLIGAFSAAAMGGSNTTIAVVASIIATIPLVIATVVGQR